MMPLERKRRLSLTSSAALMMFALVCGKVLGQIREILIQYRIGSDAVSDGFILGFQIPDLLYELLIGGAIQAAITPTLAGAIENRTTRAGWRSVSIFLNVAACVMIVFILAGWLLAPVLIPLVYGGHGAGTETAAIAVRVSRALFPQVLFMMLAALCIGILNAYRRFERTAFGPVFYNACVVAAMLLLGDRTADGAVRVAAGVMIAACLFFLLQLFLARDLFSRNYRLSLNVRDPGFRRLIRLAIPTMLAASIVQVNVIVLSAFINRSFQEEGLVTALRYASTTWQLPYGILAVAIGNVLLPTLSAHAQAGHPRRFRSLFDKGLRNALFLVVPAAALILVMREEVVRAIFQWGGVYSDVLMKNTASILVCYTFSIVIQTLIFLYGIGCFAAGNTRIPLYGGAASMAGNLVFSMVLTRIPGAGPWVMSLSFMLSGICSITLISILFRRRFPELRPRSVSRRFPVQMAVCAAASMIVVYALGLLFSGGRSKVVQLLWLGFKGLAGLLVFYLAARGLNVPEAEVYEEKVRNVLARIFRRGGSRAAGEDGDGSRED